MSCSSFGRFFLALGLSIATLSVQSDDFSAPGAFGADMLPQGRKAVRLDTRGSWSSDEFDARGNRQSLGSDYDALNLNAALFPALTALGPGATLGTTDLSARMSGQQMRLTLGYGLSENVTVGLQVGYAEAVNRVDVDVSGSTLAATGNPALPFVPLGTFGLTTPTGAEEVQNQLVNIFGYKRVQSSTWHSMLDPLVGLRWRFDQGEEHATVFAPTLRFGVAKQPDPNDLMQVVMGDGTDDILLGLSHTRKLSDRWDLLLFGQYTIQLPDHVTARARSSNELLVPASRLERVRRDRTDPTELTVETGYRLGDWRFSGRLEYARGGKDRYRSPTGQDVSGLEAATDFNYLLAYVGVSWNGIPGYLNGEGKFPAVVSVLASTTLQAKNTLAPDTLYLTVTMPF